jgi:three-Cys-motif partner protein
MADIEIASDGLPARVVKAHTREKFDRHRKYCSTFNTGMKNHWRSNRGYLELFAGPGLAIDDDTREEVDGCPLLAAGVSQPGFNKLAFVELDEELADALEQRLRQRGQGPDIAKVIRGNANDLDVLAEAIDFLPNPGLAFTFIDPEDVNNEWQALEFLSSRRYPRLDFMINLPVNGIERAGGNRHYAAITRVVGTERWIDYLEEGQGYAAAVRRAYREQLEGAGFEVVRSKQVTVAGSARVVYDLFFASKSSTAGAFWDELAKIEASGQRSLFDERVD